MSTETQSTEYEDMEDEMPTRGRVKDRDFTTVTEQHKNFAKFVNENSGLSAIKPGHVKAVLALRSDFAETPEEMERREQRRQEREQRNAPYAGLTDDQKKAKKRAERAAEKATAAQAELDSLFSG